MFQFGPDVFGLSPERLAGGGRLDDDGAMARADGVVGQEGGDSGGCGLTRVEAVDGETDVLALELVGHAPGRAARSEAHQKPSGADLVRDA
ncbi:hypothetical protein ACFW1M_03590 [Streptomyces inhibens]|uniref:hypothetical protein n=1 Tax=Streptomyces inhibens TaxID=2293571 RepID=UPI0036844423